MRPDGNRIHGGRGEREREGGGVGSYRGKIPRGEVRDLLLAALLDGPAHGYELMRRLEEKAGGRWRPSPGSVYPLLQLLEDQGLARGQEEEGRKVYELTREGQAQADHKLLSGLAAERSGSPSHRELRDEVGQMHFAAKQVGLTGKEEQVQKAVVIVREARQALYRLLADQ